MNEHEHERNARIYIDSGRGDSTGTHHTSTRMASILTTP